LLDKAGVAADAGIVSLGRSSEAFLAPARTRQWVREPNVRMLA
jgi:catalase